jgi:hypothetical protein
LEEEVFLSLISICLSMNCETCEKELIGGAIQVVFGREDGHDWYHGADIDTSKIHHYCIGDGDPEESLCYKSASLTREESSSQPVFSCYRVVDLSSDDTSHTEAV